MRYQWFLLLLIPLLLVSCGGTHGYAESEDFKSHSTYHRDFQVDSSLLCGAAQRVLLGDGYVVTKGESQNLTGVKEFQIEDKSHAILQVHVTCNQRAGGSTLFVTATEEHFDVKTSRKSTLFGVPIVAPISIGTRRETDSQVKTRGETVTDSSFYNRFYQAVQQELSH